MKCIYIADVCLIAIIKIDILSIQYIENIDLFNIFSTFK